MNPEIGHYALVLALAVAILQTVLPIWGARANDAALMRVGPSLALAFCGFVALSFAVLVSAYVRSDFSVLNVVENSHSLKPLLYRITGTWGNHEGSMLLWALVLAIFGATVALFGGNLPARLKANVLGVQGSIGVAFIAFLLLTSNPFARVIPAPAEGNDLNPVLQDIGLAIHPPLLYLGYVGFSVTFAFAVAALIDGRIDAAWARWVRPWALGAWAFLTLGIAMGSYWAYYELGWGGWWFWDPVENASLMPWLAGTALIHSAVVMEKRDALKVWTVLLAILAFSLSLLGTFLVRSGVLTSVHAFATDPTRGVFILAILVIFIGGSLTLFAARASSLRQGGIFAPISREGALVLNNLLLTAAAAAVFVGTLYPLALEATTGAKITVGPPYFNLTIGALMLPVVFAMPFGPLLAWKRGDLAGAAQRLMLAFLLGLVAAGVAAYAQGGGPALAPIGIGLAAFVFLGAVVDIAERSGIGRLPAATAFARFKGLPRAAMGAALAHAGVGVCLFGIVAETSWNHETILGAKVGDSFPVGRYELTLARVEPRTGPNYRELVGVFDIRQGGASVGSVESSKRLFTARNMPTTEAGIRTFGFSQLYVSLGDELPGGGLAIRAYWKPLVTLIWIGALIMALGGTLSLSDRRLRVGAPKPARKVAPVPKPVAAE
ncbi:heme lyase CcmF/NrfE family subunit [Ancylobacter defluvii]|uniref:C-type cytochrome biogenesis protein CcmF n=1 Tax=Ancylobacter defluvii TaxID=1282440 RepID=A0A9W6JXD1_9HYPH|nr:heme lyase CcmF/NrfE family subunit [Ancylobacter defluvii]MBS7589289.1 heme lyase CcmF/NrfE family subunit [Ancylobacter defluvii]GLK84902.1 c-type cytochrome biogenesis protein CcmF [Ancylobacter defluvii]